MDYQTYDHLFEYLLRPDPRLLRIYTQIYAQDIQYSMPKLLYLFIS